MKNYHLILASASPRRREILENAGYSPEILRCDCDESSVQFVPGSPDSAENYVKALAKLKNDAAYALLCKNGRNCANADGTQNLLLTADTIVVLSESQHPLGKPKDRREAAAMLSSLSGRAHKVITGVMLRPAGNPERYTLFSETTVVYFRELSGDEIEEYCSTDEPYDKAGAYGIQGTARKFVERIEGDYDNVVGLPLLRLASANLL